MDLLNFNSIKDIPSITARAAFLVNSSTVFKEDGDITPVPITDRLSYMPWGGDNNMPYNVIDLIESDDHEVAAKPTPLYLSAL